MKAKKVYSLCEALADITQIATSEGFEIEDSREQIALYISWAKEFERMHKKVQWGIDSACDYMEAIEYFTMFKLKCYSHYRNRLHPLEQ